MYRQSGPLLLRACLQRADTAPAAWPDLDGGHVRQWQDWLEQVWPRPGLAESVELASPVLAHQVRGLLDGRAIAPRQVRRIVTSVARYLLRLTDRPTPFGLFAGVAPAATGPRHAVRWGDHHHAVARPSPEWLAGVVTRLESCPDLLVRLPVVATSTCFTRGGRLITPSGQHVGQDQDAGHAAPVEVSVRHTRPVETALRHARSPILAGDLMAKLAADFPDTPAPVTARLVAELVGVRVLLTSLRAPMTVTDPLAHVITQLSAANADSIAEISGLAGELRAIHRTLASHNDIPLAASHHRKRAVAAERMNRIRPVTGPPVMVDLRLDTDVTVPEAVARESEAAAAALTLLTPFPRGLPALVDYHAAFIDRYGPGAVIPIKDATNPATGLGLPATYQGSARTLPAQPLSARDERLMALAYETVMDGRDEIVLTDSLLRELARGDGTRWQVPPHVELFAQVHALSLAAVERGEFRLVVTGASRAAGSTVGRFLHVLTPAEQGEFALAYAGAPVLRVGAVTAQVSCPPLHARSEGLARVPAVLADVISMAEHPGPGRVLTLDDLALSGDADGLYLVSLPGGRVVEPTLFNALAFRNFTHPVARFLCEIHRSGTAVYMPFSWGTAGSLPFLPRIRYGRTVLAPARWNLSAASLPAKNAPAHVWKEHLAGWRHRFGLPAHVYLGEADNLLRLDLGQDTHLALLRSHLSQHPDVTLHEAPDPSAYEWLDGHAHELTVILTSTAPALPSLSPAQARARVTDRGHGHLPGCSPWLFIKLSAHPSLQADVLTRVPDLLGAWETPPQWWYIRYLDPEPHLRLRLRLTHPGGYGHATQLAGKWAAGLRANGLAGRMQLDTYYPETGRYGTGAAITAAETVFAADSATAIAQLATGDGSAGQALTAASLVNIAVAFTGSQAVGMGWLTSHIPRTTANARPTRPAYTETMRLTDPDSVNALQSIPGGDMVLRTWRHREHALAAYRSALSATGQSALTDSALASLLHMHHIRAVGIDPGSEQVCHQLARSAAVAWAARTTGTHL